jgi:2-aminoethylphosphonate-pyruvate transaminase
MKLLIPGPVTTHPDVRAALAQDFAPWDNDTKPMIARVKDRALAIAGGIPGQHVALLLQGCGHYGIEAAIRTFLPPGGRILIPATGPYAARMIRLTNEAGRVAVPLAVPADCAVDPAAISAALAADPGISHVGIIHSETGSGIIHDPAAIGAAVRAHGRRTIIDSVSAFGALPLHLPDRPEIDAILFSSNKCIEALPGIVFALAPIDRLEASAGNAGSWSFDLTDIYRHGIQGTPGSFRFTPPIQIIAAFDTALDRFDAEGGQPARLARYMENKRVLYTGMVALGLTPLLAPEHQGPIVINIEAPKDPAWDLQAFVDALKRRGFLISNFYNTPEPSFRIGCIGAITPVDMTEAVAAIGAALNDIGLAHRHAA